MKPAQTLNPHSQAAAALAVDPVDAAALQHQHNKTADQAAEANLAVMDRNGIDQRIHLITIKLKEIPVGQDRLLKAMIQCQQQPIQIQIQWMTQIHKQLRQKKALMAAAELQDAMEKIFHANIEHAANI